MNRNLRFLYIGRLTFQQGGIDRQDLLRGGPVCEIGPDFALLGDDRHAVVDLNHGFIGRAGEDDEPRLTVDDLIKPAEIQSRIVLKLEIVLGLFAVVAPFVEAFGGEDRPAFPQAVRKGLLLRRGFRPGVYQQLVGVESGEAEYGGDRTDDTPSAGKPRCCRTFWGEYVCI